MALPDVNYGFIGLGIMGWGMAQNLRAKIPKSSTLVVCELVRAQRDRFVAETEGLIAVEDTPRGVAEKADIIITMLPKGPHVQGVFLTPETGLLACPKNGKPKLFIDCSTIDVKTSLLVGEEVKKSELGSFADAPVSGGPNGVINVSSGKCYNSLDQNPVKGVTNTAAAAKDFEGGFSVELCKGVVDMAVGLGQEVGAKSVLSDIVQDTFSRALKSDKCSGKDCRSVYRLFAEDDGKDLD